MPVGLTFDFVPRIKHLSSLSNRNFLGLPAWAFPGWRDRYFEDTPSRLASYAQVFNTVEGNTTFYRTPDAATIGRWRDAVEGSSFRFCFKLPRAVTHEHSPDMDTLDRFLEAVAPLDEHLGPFFVQFPATLAPEKLDAFVPVFAALAASYRFVIEVRHRAFFDNPQLLEPTLDRFGAGRVVLDSRPLYQGDRSHPEVLDALHEKPDVPVRSDVYHQVAFIRLILHPDLPSNERYIEEWAQHAAGYLRDDVETYMMIHCPNNLHCPLLAERFHEALRHRAPDLELPALPPWPIPQQRDLLV